MNTINLREADRAEVTILVDNYVDMLMLPSTAIDKRPQTPPGKPLLAAHGYHASSGSLTAPRSIAC